LSRQGTPYAWGPHGPEPVSVACPQVPLWLLTSEYREAVTPPQSSISLTGPLNVARRVRFSPAEMSLAFAEVSGPDDLSRRLQAAFPEYRGSSLLSLQNCFVYASKP
jgi:hypothetical protein